MLRCLDTTLRTIHWPSLKWHPFPTCAESSAGPGPSTSFTPRTWPRLFPAYDGPTRLWQPTVFPRRTCEDWSRICVDAELIELFLLVRLCISIGTGMGT